jgi:hypothetical protein
VFIATIYSGQEMTAFYDMYKSHYNTTLLLFKSRYSALAETVMERSRFAKICESVENITSGKFP